MTLCKASLYIGAANLVGRGAAFSLASSAACLSMVACSSFRVPRLRFNGNDQLLVLHLLDGLLLVMTPDELEQ